MESPEPLLEEDSADWETVPTKPKREAAALLSSSAPAAGLLSSAAAAPDGWAESPTADDTAGQWEIPHKHTKLTSHQANSSPAPANGIKAMRDAKGLKGSMNSDSAEGSRHQRGNRGRGRGHNRGRGRGRNYSNDRRGRQDRSQQVQGDDGWTQDPGTTALHNSSGEEEGVPSSWGADTVFPLSQSPMNPSLLSKAEPSSSAPRVLTIPRPAQTRSMASGGVQQQPRHQQGRGYRDSRARGSNSSGRGGRGRQSAQAGRVQSCPVYDISDQPACQQISFGSFGPEFGTTLQQSTTNPAAHDGESSSSNQVYQQQQHEHVPRQQVHKRVHRGRGRGSFPGRGRSASERNNRQEATQVDAVTSA